ncbi:hypothetical protein [Bradyrhizobium sp. USDA 329]|uniref:hypothetical protein n=1 Tax=unclassified Bradyrhizobium TaxID=2631580 RepID=UPI0035132AEB
MASRCTGAAWSGRWRAKKTTYFNLIVPPADATDRYEELRAAVLRGSSPPASASAFFAAKGSLHGSERRHAEMAYCDHPTTPAIKIDPLPAAGDLTRLIAGIIIAIAMEPAHG